MRGRILPLTLLGLTVIAGFGILWKGKLSRAQTDQTDTTCCGGDATSGPRELDFPYYSLRDGFGSTLNLVSASPKPIDLTIAIRSKTGQTLLAPPRTIQPQEKLALDLRQLLMAMSADTAGDFAEGSVAVYFGGTIMPVVGQVTVTNPTTGMVHESEMVENDPGRSDIPAVLNSGWWNLSSGRDAKVMVSNTSGDAAMADVFLDFQGERHASAPITLLPHETKTLSVLSLLGDLGVSPSEAPEGGISIVARGSNPKLIAQGKVFDTVTGFSTTLDFPDPARQLKSALHASGVPIGTPTEDSPFAGMGNFVPHVVARNLLSTAQSVTITLEYPDGKFGLRGKEEFNGEGGEETGTMPLGPFVIEPYGSQDISLIAAMGQLPLPLAYCSIRIQHSGPPGSLVAQVSAVDSKQNLVVDSRVANEGDGWAGSGANPWRLDNETESILFLTNMSDKDAQIGFQVNTGDIHYYLTNLKLDPHETRAIDIRKLRDGQQPDFQGSTIPAEATDGSVIWVRIDNVPVMGRLLVIQHHKGIASNFDCEPNPCPPVYTTLGASPTAFAVLVSATANLTSTATFKDSNNNLYYYNETSASNWSSSNTSVATVSGGKVTGKAGGSVGITAAFTAAGGYNNYQGICNPIYITRTGGSSGNVQVPTILQVVSNTTATNICGGTTGGTSCTRLLLYRVLDQNSNPILRQGMTVRESYSNVTGSCGGTVNDGGVWTTDSSGRMTAYDMIDTCCGQGANCWIRLDQRFSVNYYPVVITNGVSSGPRNIISITCSSGSGTCPVVTPSP